MGGMFGAESSSEEDSSSDDSWFFNVSNFIQKNKQII